MIDGSSNFPASEYGYDDYGVGSEAGSLEEFPITFRQIATETGHFRRCEVKILEQGDGYEVCKPDIVVLSMNV